MYLLDTNVISELRKSASGRADLNVVAWAASIESSAMYLSVISLLEIKMGILRLTRNDDAQSAMLGSWLQKQVIPTFAGRTLSIDTAVALKCAELHVPDPRSERDALIAATALTHGMTVVTRNVGDFVRTGAEYVDPWQYVD